MKITCNSSGFQYWADMNGNVVSYAKTYRFPVLKETSLVAVVD